VGTRLRRKRLGSGLRRGVGVWVVIAAIITAGASSAWALWGSSAVSTQEPTTGSLVTPSLTLDEEGNSVTSLYGEISTVACPSSTLCFAGAGHDSATSTPSGYSPLLEWQGTTWSATTAPEYMGAINLISCASASTCLAVGEGDSTSPGAVVDAPSWSWWNGTSWSPAVATPLPTSDQAWWRGASCVATSSGSLCWIVGTNVEKTGTAPPDGGYGFEITDTTGSAPTAGSVEAIGPPSADWAELTGVSCPTSMTCYANGDIGTTEVGVWEWDGSSWNSQPVSTISDPIPSGQPSTTRMVASEGISCAATDLCEAVGSEMYLPTGSTDMTSSAFADVLSGTTWDARVLETSGITQNLGLSSACSGNTTYPMCWMGGSGDGYNQFATVEPFTSSGFGTPNFVGLSGVQYGDSLNSAGSGPEGAWRTDQIDYVIAVACAPPSSSSATSTTCWAGGEAKDPTSSLSNTDAPDAGFLAEWNGTITASNGGWPFLEATWTPDSAIQPYGSQVYYAQNVPTGSTTSTCIQDGVSNYLAYLGGGEVNSGVQSASSFQFPSAVMGDECVLVSPIIANWGSPAVPTVAVPSATIVG